VKILRVAGRLSRLGGGVAVYVREMATRQAALGHEVTVAGLAGAHDLG